MVVLTRKQVDNVAARKIRISFWLAHFTGQHAVAPHPFIRSHRLVWSSSAKPGSLVANHLPFNY